MTSQHCDVIPVPRLDTIIRICVYTGWSEVTDLIPDLLDGAHLHAAISISVQVTTLHGYLGY